MKHVHVLDCLTSTKKKNLEKTHVHVHNGKLILMTLAVKDLHIGSSHTGPTSLSVETRLQDTSSTRFFSIEVRVVLTVQW
ncbi:hypothetical protein INR49_002623 [Caranx melampygus]|nr:hypothetical protein INR49_002623 [Caranx melampygus]